MKTPTRKTQSATLLSKANTAKADTANAVVLQQDGPDIPMILNIVDVVTMCLGQYSRLGGGFGPIVDS